MIRTVLAAIGYLLAAIVVAFGVWALCLFLAVQ